MEFGMRSGGMLDFHFYHINTIDTRLMQLCFLLLYIKPMYSNEIS